MSPGADEGTDPEPSGLGRTLLAGAAAGLGGGLTFGVLRGVSDAVLAAAGHRDRPGPASLLAATWEGSAAGLGVGLLVGLLALPTPARRGPIARLRAFVRACPGGPGARVAAIAVGLAVFFHGSLLAGRLAAERFHNATLAAALLVAVEAAIALPAFAAGRLAERALLFRTPWAPRAVVLAAAASVGAALAPHLGLRDLAVVPMAALVAAGAVGGARLVAPRGRGR